MGRFAARAALGRLCRDGGFEKGWRWLNC